MSDETKTEEKVTDDTEKVIDDKTRAEKPDEKVDGKKDDKVDPAKYEKAVQAQNVLDGILEKHGYASIDELQESIEKGKSLQELIGDKDAKELVKKAHQLDEYESHWQEEKEKKKEEEESPEETIERLKKELKEKRLKDKEKKAQQEKRENAIKAIKNFNSIVTSEIGKDSEITESVRPFVEMFIGVNNPANEVDINRPVDIRKMAREMVKSFKEFQQLVIKDYLKGKSDITNIDPTDGAGPAESKKIMNLKEARVALAERYGIKQ